VSDGTKADDIALALEEAIVSGEIPPGSTLRQEHLSEQFQVSRTPVREALRRLAALGLVTFEPNRGVRVRMLSLDEIREAFMVRAELESLATEIATPKMTDDDLAELERAERRFHRATERLVEMSHEGRQDLEVARDWLHLNHSFHDVIYRAADVPLIERMAKAARRTFLVKPVWATGADLDELYLKNDRQHRAIRDAIAARSPEGARVLAREHVLSSGRLLEAILDKVSSQSREGAVRERASVTFERRRGAVGSRPRDRASAHAKSCPGTIERNGARSGDEVFGVARTYWACGTDSAADPLATIVAPASCARSTASTTAGRFGSSDAIAQTGKSESRAATGPCARSVAVSGSAAIRHVSSSLRAISRAVANSAPRPTTNIRPA